MVILPTIRPLSVVYTSPFPSTRKPPQTPGGRHQLEEPAIFGRVIPVDSTVQ